MDDLLPAIGEFGRYQKLLLWLICLPACIPCGFCAFNQLFMTDTPDDYWCAIPQLQHLNLTVDQLKNLAIPLTLVSMTIEMNEQKSKAKINVIHNNCINYVLTYGICCCLYFATGKWRNEI